MLSKAVKVRNEGVTVELDVVAGAKKSDIGYDEWRNVVTVKVMSQPRKGKANSEILKKFKELLEKEVDIISGHTSSRKVLLVHDITESELVERLKDIIKVE